MRRRRLGLICAALALLLVPAVALADNLLTIRDGVATFRSDDAGIANAFIVEDRPNNEVRFYEPNDPKGVNFPPQCRPGATRGTVAIEAFCPKNQVSVNIIIEAGPASDSVVYAVAGVPGTVVGDTGADKITSTAASNDSLAGDQGNDELDGGPGDDDLQGEDGDDTIKGGDGNDKLNGGAGVDTIDAGNGDDTVSTADGYADKVDCGAGTDSEAADTADDVVNCENLTRTYISPPPDAGPSNDKTRPLLELGGLTVQRVSPRRRTITVLAKSNEKGQIALTGFLAADGVNNRLTPKRANINVAGAGARIKITLSARLMKLVMRDLRRHRRPNVNLTASSVDAAGNTSKAKHLRIVLRRAG